MPRLRQALALILVTAFVAVPAASAESLAQLEAAIEDQLPALTESFKVPGYVGAVFHKGEVIHFAEGVRNTVTGEPMTVDTAWLLGSVTKVLTTTMLLQYVESGDVDLDAPVTKYLPDFELNEPGLADRITVRMLVNHTNGIDADSLMPTQEVGRDAVASYVDLLDNVGTLFEPGTFVHYTNPGFTLAGRIMETISGKSFNELIEERLFGPTGMTRSVTSAEQAIVHRTAVGAFPTEDGFRQTNMFMLPVSGAAAGATPIVTVDDMIAFGRMHLAGGVAPNGNRILGEEYIELMQKTTVDIGTPNVPPIGLGWIKVPIAGTTALWHGGGSPGGSSSFAVFPDHDLIIVGFGNSPGSGMVHDALITLVLQSHLGLEPDLPFEPSEGTRSLAVYEGVYESFQTRNTIETAEDGISLTNEFVPFDEEHHRFLSGYTGTTELKAPPASYRRVAEDLFAPAALPDSMLVGIYGRMALLSFHYENGSDKPTRTQGRFRTTPRVE